MADELRVRLLAEDRLSTELKDAQKSVRDLKKELIAAAREAESTGDFSKVRQLEKSYEGAQQAAGKLRGELKQLQRESKNTGDATVKSASKMQQAWGKLRDAMKNPLVTAVSAGAVILFAKNAVQSFAEVEDATDALTSTFGESGENLVAWANTTAISFNLSRREALNAAQTMAVFGDSAGVAGEELEEFAISLTERAAEAASFFGGTTQDAVTAFGSALRGEMEPIRKYGVLLDDATLRTRAFEMGLTSTTTQALTPQQKTLAAYNAIMEQTTRVQGDVARTADSMGNQIKQSQAQMENLRSSVGETLAVALAPLAGILGGILSAFNTLPQGMQSFLTVLGFVGAAILIIGPRLAAMGLSLDVIRTKAVAAGGAMKAFAINSKTAVVGMLALTAAITAASSANGGQGLRIPGLDDTNDALRELVQPGLLGSVNNFFVGLGDAIAFGSLDTRLEQAARGMSEFDGAVSQLVAAGEVDKAQSQVTKLVEASAEWGATTEDVMSLLPGLRAALNGAGLSIDKNGKIIERTTGRFTEMWNETRQAGIEFQKSQRSLGTYRSALQSSSAAARELRDAQNRASQAAGALTEGLDGVNAAVNRQQTLQAYRDALQEFIADPSDATAAAVSTAMTSAASAIENPREQAEFTATAIDNIKAAAQDAGLKLNPVLESALDTARGKAILLDRQIDRAVRARTVEINLRFNDSRYTYGGERKAVGGWIGGSTGGPTSDTVPVLASRGEFMLRGGAAAALRQAIGDTGMWQLNHADRSLPDFMSSPVPQFVTTSTREPVPVGASSPVINIGEINADSGVDVQAEVLWAMRRADRIRRERGA